MPNKNKKTKIKQAYKSNSKNINVYIVITILVLLLLQFIALGLSRAQRLVEIEVLINDSENLLEDKIIILDAIDFGDSGSFILLPEKIDNIHITEYHVKDMSIIDEYEEEDENEEDALDYEVKVAGEKLYLTDDELSAKEMELLVVYNSKEAENSSSDERLYYQELYLDEVDESEEELSNIFLEGFMPLGLEFSIDTEIPSDAAELLDETIDEDANIEKLFKVEFTLDEEDYDFSELEESLTISMLPVDTDKIYFAYSLKKKSEYIGKTNVKDALGNPINTFDIDEIKYISFNKELLYMHVLEVEYLALVSKERTFSKGFAPLGGGMMPMGMEIPLGFDPLTSTDVWDGSVSTSFLGTGQANNPYLITSGADLAYLENRVNAGTTYENQYFQLTNNIDLDNREWVPIGEYNRSFRGNFDGSGKVIKNALIIASGTMPTNSAGNVHSYGLFGSIGGGTNANNRQTIENLELENIIIESRYSGNTVTTTTDRIFGINLGTLVGTMFQNSTISNVNVRNMDIHHSTVTMQVRSYRFQYFIGGLVGEAIRLPNNATDPGVNLRYSITNCVVDGNINLSSVTANSARSAGQFAAAGIIGRIRYQAVWPESCIYRGDVYSSHSFIGPIFGQLRQTAAVSSNANRETLWQGNDAGNLTCTSSYNTYRAYNTTFTNTVISGTSTARRSTSNSDIGYVQGVNKGIYQNNNNTLLTALNQNSSSSNVKWQYSAQNGFSLRPRLKININENPENTFSIQVDDSYYSATPYQHQWIINDVVSSNTTSVYVHTNPSFDVDLNITVRTRDTNGYYSIYNFVIPRLYVEITFNINYNQNTAQANLSGTGWYLTGYSDYSFQWYKEDISGYEEEEIVGATSRTITGLDTAYDYKLIATNNVIPQLSCENSFEYAVRTVIYVSSSGNNNNNGLTPTTPVRDFANAYGKLPANGTRDTNVIVVMNSITDNALFTGETATTYRRDVTITGTYKKTSYTALIRLNGSSTYKYMNGDTTFMYLTINGNNDQLYWYLQGYSLTIGEQVTMTGYTTANTNQGLITGNAPGFHIFCSWHRYNYATLPRNNPKVLIKSGTFGRIVGGGSPGTNAVANLQNTTSRNFIGSANDPFNIEITIDIQNSTKASTHAYDLNLLVGGSAAGNNYSNVVHNIKSGSVGRVLGGAIGDSSVRPSNWNYPLNTFMGTVEVNISGGTVVELYGGSLGRNMSALTGSSSIMCDSYFYGVVEINITGGTISGDIYGAGAGRSVWVSY